MNLLLAEFRHNPLLWLLAFVPMVFAAAKLDPEAHTLRFVRSVLAMKCLALRIGTESHDEDDIRYLLRHLAVGSYEQAVAVIARFYSLKRFPQKTLYALDELLPKQG
jgi:hypothetical protein